MPATYDPRDGDGFRPGVPSAILRRLGRALDWQSGEWACIALRRD